MILKKIPILDTNYVWIIHDEKGSCIIIDPGSSIEVIEEIQKKKWNPIAILLTHNHIDHVGGVKKIIKYYPNITVFGPYETIKNGCNKIVFGGDKIILLNRKFYIYFTPGHTPGHVSYYSKPYFFCGDTLFSGGCGRVYKDNYLDMFNSIHFISSFPNNTFLCCSHEYTLSNLSFSMFIFPKDQTIKMYYEKIKKIIDSGKSSLPSYIIFEKKVNLFLRKNDEILKNYLELKTNCSNFEVFKQLRLQKDYFIGAKRD
ncbi:hydroxyacylglutathione hydrolase [Buchnera aphidicola (Brachycaudus cardui)]|uniref:Hydroxyacylglutathione hydrolase n=1 Tax=Buchnera aphidicola (Brachycaudus cardui) TaxID=557993 RepID=A0A4D6Y2R3_9GAMM|nr:hydroxyacylglutathione hydrolase [Buchnera aphidicola]QCI20390.1 hydroxyacylglutathione hydrolase [Buchnera aphidicola (Brachycaudus cardui)]